MTDPMSPGVKTLIVVALIGAAGAIAAAVITILPDILNDPMPGPSRSAAASPSTGASPTPFASPSPTEVPTPTPSPLSFLGRVAGSWTLQSWTEASGPVTLYIEVLNGEMEIGGIGSATEGQADWRMDIQERNEPTSPQPEIRCGGQTTLAGMIEGVPGGDRNAEINWTADLRSINGSETGEKLIFRALCGWSIIGDPAPFTVTLEGDPTQPATRMEMTNEEGTYRWTR